MAPPSPRRSSRARATNSQSQQSSVSSGTSGRPERNVERSTRSLNKPSSGKSTPSASLSSEPLEDLDDTLLGRRRKRGQDDESEKTIPPGILNMANGSDDLQDEEDEAVRCLCGSEDYPGRPPVDGPDADLFADFELTDDVTGFFVQCDICKVWQHGACVGIFSAESSPDEYFCEQCRKDLHKVHLASNGQKYSKYLPLHRTSRATSLATSVTKDGTRSPKGREPRNSRGETAAQASKRRSTMNSRDAAYDDEQLRRAIEASKEGGGGTDATEGPPRRPKRGRSDSLENSTTVKRQRTSSRSVSPPAEQPEPPNHEESDDENRIGPKNVRVSRHQRRKSEQEDRLRLRQEAADKRKGRAERRRADDSDLSEELPLAAAKLVVNKPIEPEPTIEEPPPPPPPAVVQPPPGTPPTMQVTVGSSHKRGARSTQKKGKGKNQYTREREGDNDESPARSMSRDIQKNADEATSIGQAKPVVSESKAGPKVKPAMASKMSMLDMKRRVAAIMDFISRTQVDLAAENGDSPSSGHQTPDGTTPKIGAANTNGDTPETPDAKGFKELNCMEMMDVLTRDMVKWQNQYS